MPDELPDELVIPLPNGNSLVCGPGEFYQWGGSVTIRNSKGEDLRHWTYEEWGDDPECVMGAIFSAALDKE